MMNQANEQEDLLQPTDQTTHDTCNDSNHTDRSEREMIDGVTLLSRQIDTSPTTQQEERSTPIPPKSSSKGIKRKAQKEQLPTNQPTGDTSSMETPIVGTEVASGRWSVQEHDAFIRGLALYGREWKRVAQIIPTRTSAQVRSHAQKYFHHFELQQQRLQQQRHMNVIDTTQQEQQHRSHITTHTSHITNNSDADSVSSMSLHGSSNRGNSVLNFDSTTFSRMSNSVREQVERIMSNPSSVHNEVNLTLSQLRQRYQELQNRYIKLQVQQSSSRNDIIIQANKNSILRSTRSNDESMISSHSNNNNLDEQIVIEVLQGRLQHSSPIHTTATSATTALHTASNHDSQQHSYLKTSINSYDYDGDAESDNDEMNT